MLTTSPKVQENSLLLLSEDYMDTIREINFRFVKLGVMSICRQTISYITHIAYNTSGSRFLGHIIFFLNLKCLYKSNTLQL